MSARQPSAPFVFFVLFLVYITWGSTYIGYKLTLEVCGPFFAAGARSFAGGVLLACWLVLRGQWRRPSLPAARRLAGFGVPMVVMASGLIAVGQTQVPSSVAAVLTSSCPIIMILAGWLFAGEPRLAPLQCLGLVAGSVAIARLGFQQAGSGGEHSALGCLAVVAAAAGWVAGSLAMKKRPLEDAVPPLEATCLLLLSGGLEALLLGLLFGEHNRLHWDHLHPAVAIAFAWMTVGGSIIAYAAYMWLLTHVRLAVAVSYEYVVPVVGIFLGWLFGGERVTLGVVAACAAAVGAVFLVVTRRTGDVGPFRHAGTLARWRRKRTMHVQTLGPGIAGKEVGKDVGKGAGRPS